MLKALDMPPRPLAGSSQAPSLALRFSAPFVAEVPGERSPTARAAAAVQQAAEAAFAAVPELNADWRTNQRYGVRVVVHGDSEGASLVSVVQLVLGALAQRVWDDGRAVAWVSAMRAGDPEAQLGIDVAVFMYPAPAGGEKSTLSPVPEEVLG